MMEMPGRNEASERLHLNQTEASTQAQVRLATVPSSELNRSPPELEHSVFLPTEFQRPGNVFQCSFVGDTLAKPHAQ